MMLQIRYCSTIFNAMQVIFTFSSVQLDANDVFRLPSELERKDAAAIVYGHSTALYAFSKLCTLKEKDRLLISAGPAGLGLAAVDVAANIYKAQVI